MILIFCDFSQRGDLCCFPPQSPVRERSSGPHWDSLGLQSVPVTSLGLPLKGAELADALMELLLSATLWRQEESERKRRDASAPTSQKQRQTFEDSGAAEKSQWSTWKEASDRTAWRGSPWQQPTATGLSLLIGLFKKDQKKKRKLAAVRGQRGADVSHLLYSERW